MLTLEQVSSLVDTICTRYFDFTEGCDPCEKCPIYNFFNRGGGCVHRLYMSQGDFRVHELIEQLRSSM